jgi:hypothetical protein
MPVPLNRLIPHVRRTGPQTPLSIESTVHNHRFFRLTVSGDADHFILIALKMPVAAWPDRFYCFFVCHDFSPLWVSMLVISPGRFLPGFSHLSLCDRNTLHIITKSGENVQLSIRKAMAACR